MIMQTASKNSLCDERANLHLHVILKLKVECGSSLHFVMYMQLALLNTE